MAVDEEAKALAHFKRVDPILHRAAVRFNKKSVPRVAEKRSNQALFEALAGSVVSQQLSTKAADTIWARLKSACGGKVTPAAIGRLRSPILRKAGLSAAKVKTLKELSREIKNGLTLTSLRKVSEEEAVAELTKIWGIGTWTAEMFLIFALGRPDVFSPGDLGLVRSIEALYGLPKNAPKESIVEISARWAPYRSLACLVLWHARDTK